MYKKRKRQEAIMLEHEGFCIVLIAKLTRKLNGNVSTFSSSLKTLYSPEYLEIY